MRDANGAAIRAWRLLLPGLLIGLGVYEQPGVLLLAIPLIVMLMLAFPHSGADVARWRRPGRSSGPC